MQCPTCVDETPQWKEVFVSQMPNTWTRERFNNLCTTSLLLRFGSVAEHCVSKIWFDDAPGGSFGFVSFSTHDAACWFVNNVSGMQYDGWMLYVSRHYNKRQEAARAVDTATGTLLNASTVTVDVLKQVVLTQNQLIKSLVVGQEQMMRRIVTLEQKVAMGGKQ
jgi:hypothetical protein